MGYQYLEILKLNYSAPYLFLIYYLKKIWLKLRVIFIAFLIIHPLKSIASDLKIISPPTSNDRILVVVAHPDDETIGLGGYLAQAIKNGAQVKVVIVTNGEGNKYYAYFGEKKIFSKEKFIYEENVRINEAINALNVLGLEPDKIVFLGFPDRGLIKLLSKNWSRVYISPFTGQSEPIFKNNYNLSSKYRGEDL
ncbi:MAG: PIG-L family deacetylase, partial [Nitrososphaeria archaeon]